MFSRDDAVSTETVKDATGRQRRGDGCMKPKKHHHYSGPRPTAFWARVNALPDDRRGELYSCGVFLQNLEESVLAWLADAEKYSEGKP